MGRAPSRPSLFLPLSLPLYLSESPQHQHQESRLPSSLAASSCKGRRHLGTTLSSVREGAKAWGKASEGTQEEEEGAKGAGGKFLEE